MRAHRYENPHRTRLPQAQVAQCVERLEGVVVELALVVDPAHARAQHEVAFGEDLVPEGLDLGDLGEEAVASQVEAPPVALDGAADAPDDLVRLEDERALAALGQQVRRRQPTGARAGDDDGRFGGGGHEQGRLVDPPFASGEGAALSTGVGPATTGAATDVVSVTGPRC